MEVLTAIDNRLFPYQSSDEQLFRTLFENSSIGFGLFNKQRKLLEINPAFAGMLKIKAGKIAKEIVKIHPILNHPYVLKAINNNVVTNYEFVVTPDLLMNGNHGKIHSQKVLDISIIPLTSAENELLYIAQVNDITIIRETEENLRKSEEQYRNLAESAKDLIFIISETGHVLYVNSFCADYLKPVANKLTGKHLSDLFAVYLPDHYLLQIGDVIKNNAALESEECFPLLGRTVWLDIKLMPLMNIGGKATAVLGIGRDITDRKNAEEKLRQSEERLNLALDSSGSVAWTAHIDTREIDVTKQLVQLTGYEVMPGGNTIENWFNIIHPDDRAVFFNDLTRHLEGKTPQLNVEYRLIDKKGGIRWVLVRGNVTAFDIHGNPKQVSGVMVDITLIRDLQAQLEQWNKTLERKVKSGIRKSQMQQQQLIQKSKLESLGEMAAGIVHEINQPLGLLSLQLDSLNDILNEDSVNLSSACKKIDYCFDQISRISLIIEQMRGFSRDKIMKVLNILDINVIIEHIIGLIRAQYAHYHIVLSFSATSGLPPVKGVASQIEQVIFNLLSNAKYAIDKKAKEMDNHYPKEITIRTELDNKNIAIIIRDNGIGISKKNQSRIFDPFFTTKPEGIGTGLGLSICYSIISEMGGKILVESQWGEYTQIRVLLPVIV